MKIRLVHNDSQVIVNCASSYKTIISGKISAISYIDLENLCIYKCGISEKFSSTYTVSEYYKCLVKINGVLWPAAKMHNNKVIDIYGYCTGGIVKYDSYADKILAINNTIYNGEPCNSGFSKHFNIKERKSIPIRNFSIPAKLLPSTFSWAIKQGKEVFEFVDQIYEKDAHELHARGDFVDIRNYTEINYA